MSDSWALVELICRAAVEALDVKPLDVANVVKASIAVLRQDSTLAQRLLLPGGETRQEYGAVKPHHSSQDYTVRSTADAAVHTAHVWGPGARAMTRFTTDWPDGSRYTTPWKEIEVD